MLQSAANCDGTQVASSLSNQTIQLFGVSSGGGSGGSGTELAHVVSLGDDGGGRRRAGHGHGGRISDLAFSPVHPHVLVSCGSDQRVCVWDTRVGNRAALEWSVGADATALAVTTDGRQVAVATEPPPTAEEDDSVPSVALFDLSKGNVVQKFEEAHSETVTRLRWHPHRPSVSSA